MRVLGIDYGDRRIGVALSDPTGTIASPLPTLVKRRAKRPPIGKLEEIARSNEVEAVVIGLPLGADGNETEWTQEVRDIGATVHRRLGVPVHFVDERMTSARAKRVVRRSLGLPKGKREEKGRIDAAAAVLILQSWLDARTCGGEGGDREAGDGVGGDGEGGDEEGGDGEGGGGGDGVGGDGEGGGGGDGVGGSAPVKGSDR